MFCLSERIRLRSNNLNINIIIKAIDETPLAGNTTFKNDSKMDLISFATIGGLNKIKEKLIEIFRWPILVFL